MPQNRLHRHCIVTVSSLPLGRHHGHACGFRSLTGAAKPCHPFRSIVSADRPIKKVMPAASSARTKTRVFCQKAVAGALHLPVWLGRVPTMGIHIEIGYRVACAAARSHHPSSQGGTPASSYLPLNGPESFGSPMAWRGGRMIRTDLTCVAIPRGWRSSKRLNWHWSVLEIPAKGFPRRRRWRHHPRPDNAGKGACGFGFDLDEVFHHSTSPRHRCGHDIARFFEQSSPGAGWV